MAKGDIITGSLGTGAGFVPAAGVEIMITALTATTGPGNCNWGLGALAAGYVVVPSGGMTAAVVIKAGITNSCGIYAGNGPSYYSGVQVK